MIATGFCATWIPSRKLVILFAMIVTRAKSAGYTYQSIRISTTAAPCWSPSTLFLNFVQLNILISPTSKTRRLKTAKTSWRWRTFPAQRTEYPSPLHFSLPSKRLASKRADYACKIMTKINSQSFTLNVDMMLFWLQNVMKMVILQFISIKAFTF